MLMEKFDIDIREFEDKMLTRQSRGVAEGGRSRISLFEELTKKSEELGTEFV